MRIIGGKHRSRLIKYPKSIKTRPTADNVREAVFNMLGDISNYIILDLFAGSGAYGLESLSRGANFIYFNDLSIESAKIIKDNLNAINEKNSYKITNLDYLKAIEYYKRNNVIFDLVFIDPPYHNNYYEIVLEKIYDVLKQQSKIIVEIDNKLQFNINNNNYTVLKERRYGSKKILVLIVN